MLRIVGIAGSLRSGSFNAALLRAAVEECPPQASLQVESIRGIPLYDGDVEAAQGIPPAVAVLKDRIARADGLLLVTPEYNGSLPGVFKNAIDWLSRPGSDTPRVMKPSTSDICDALSSSRSGPRQITLTPSSWAAFSAPA